MLSHLKGLKSAPQSAIAVDRVCWQGEAVAAVVASSRAQAEDAAELVAVEYEELDAVTDMPWRQRLHWPQPAWISTLIRSPISNSSTSGPSAATVPMPEE